MSPVRCPSAVALLFALAALVALFASSCGPPRRDSGITYWDVAGALVLLGACAAALVDPDHMVRLVEGPQRDN